MTEEMEEIGQNFSHRRIGRLMRQNGISLFRTRKHKVTTDNDHQFNIAPNLLGRDFTADKPNQKWAHDTRYVWTREGCFYPPNPVRTIISKSCGNTGSACR